MNEIEKQSIVDAVMEAVRGLAKQFNGGSVTIKNVNINITMNNAQGGGAMIVNGRKPLLRRRAIESECFELRNELETKEERA